jgi:hypothetical protein
LLHHIVLEILEAEQLVFEVQSFHPGKQVTKEVNENQVAK